VSAKKNHANDRGVNVLRREDEKKVKMKKKITEPETKTKTSELFSDFQPVLLREQEDVAVIPSPGFTKNKSTVNKTIRFLKPGS